MKCQTAFIAPADKPADDPTIGTAPMVRLERFIGGEAGIRRDMDDRDVHRRCGKRRRRWAL